MCAEGGRCVSVVFPSCPRVTQREMTVTARRRRPTRRGTAISQVTVLVLRWYRGGRIAGRLLRHPQLRVVRRWPGGSDTGLPPGPVRVGGFGGVPAVDFLRRNRSRVVDATHVFPPRSLITRFGPVPNRNLGGGASPSRMAARRREMSGGRFVGGCRRRRWSRRTRRRVLVTGAAGSSRRSLWIPRTHYVIRPSTRPVVRSRPVTVLTGRGPFRVDAEMAVSGNRVDL